jgi:hypothetical protein
MTDDQKRQLRGDVAVELEDAKDNLSALSVKALRLSDNLKFVANWIADRARIIPSPSDFNPTIEPVRPETKYQDAMNFTELLSLDAELKQARQNVINANTHKKMLDESRKGTVRLD